MKKVREESGDQGGLWGIVDHISAPPGWSFRGQIEGPENDLVTRLIDVLPISRAPDSMVTIIREPNLEVGFPDIVVVVWRANRTAGWGDTRTALSTQDFKLMHYVFQRRRVPESEIAEVYGRTSGRRALQRLEDAGLVRRRACDWVPRAIDKIFAATKIIAIEAKIGKWNQVLYQARRNTWFASKSYILVPAVTDDQLASARSCGVGVLSPSNDSVREWPSEQGKLPVSYASWMLNDLAWKMSRARG